ncbi:MAG TPA: tRNA (adenosine(37)-N6)-threonylcarbamoyltransferase complex ATPase subunit type 1 TsaE [Patescibacteria group bacterium]|nr:tRNA (adenosine(37)-N6)-threonylcarbamoyltransferase complex ATPase subunit type 1 TsaE [Patescibacteria group bacterium]
MEILSRSPDETKELGQALSKELSGGEIIELIGDLGSGKTTFVQGLAAGLGITKRVLSPTFILRRSYVGRLNLEHFDFYRLNRPEDLAGLDLDDVLEAPKTVVVMEWPERVGLDQSSARKIKFEYIDDKTRKITL